MQQKIIILDFGSQTTQLIGRRVRELDTFCEILPYNKFPKDDPSVIGVILSGSPFSVHDPEAFQVDLSQFVGRVPVLGICYGAQFISHANGGRVEKTNTREYGRAHLQYVDTANPLFNGFAQNSQVWMSHGDSITAIPAGYECIASTSDVKYAAYYSANPSSAGTAPLFAVQFQPEVFHTAGTVGAAISSAERISGTKGVPVTKFKLCTPRSSSSLRISPRRSGVTLFPSRPRERA